MGQPLKKDTESGTSGIPHVRVTVETVRDASRRVSKAIDSLTDRLSREAGAEAAKSNSAE